MKMQRNLADFLFFWCILLLTQGRDASAQLFSSMNFDQAVAATSQLNGSSNKSVSSTTVPIQQTVTATTNDGGFSTATYSVTDNGTVATLDITCSGSITTSDTSAIETFVGSGTTFGFSEPVSYTATLTESGQGSLECMLLNRGVLPINAVVSGSSEVFTGTIDPAYGNASLYESWGIFNNSPSPTKQSGGDSLQFTFTSIPEPASAALMGIPAVFLLARRRGVTLNRQARPRPFHTPFSGVPGGPRFPASVGVRIAALRARR